MKSILFIALIAGSLTACTTLDAINPFSGKAKTGARKAAALPTVPELKASWKSSVGSAESYAFSPAVVGEAVFVASASGEVRRVEAGNAIWKTSMKDRLSGGVGADNERVAVGTAKGEVIAMEAKSGKEIWRAKASSEILAAPAVVDGMVIVRSGDSRLYAYDAKDGKRRWVYQRTTPALTLRSSVGVTVHGGKTYAGFPGGKLVAVANANGAAVWEATVALPRGATELERVTDITSEPVVADQLICAVAYQGKLACFDIASGNSIWNRDISSSVGLDIRNGQLVVADDKGVVQAFALANGASLWKQDKLEGLATSRPLHLGKQVVVGDALGRIHVLDSDTGEFTARAASDSSGIRSPFAGMNGGWVVQSADGSLYRFAGSATP